MKVNIYLCSSIKAPSRLHSGVAGYVLQADDTNNTKTVFGIVENITKNHADVRCLRYALAALNEHCDTILIHTDSNYLKYNLECAFKRYTCDNLKYANEWEYIYNVLRTRKFEVILGEHNEFKNWLQSECDRRAKKHGFK